MESITIFIHHGFCDFHMARDIMNRLLMVSEQNQTEVLEKSQRHLHSFWHHSVSLHHSFSPISPEVKHIHYRADKADMSVKENMMLPVKMINDNNKVIWLTITLAQKNNWTNFNFIFMIRLYLKKLRWQLLYTYMYIFYLHDWVFILEWTVPYIFIY